MCPAHRDLPTPSHPHSRLNLPHPIPSHTYNGLKTFSLSTTPPGRSPPSAQPFVPSTVAYRHKSTKLPSSTTKHSKKKPEGCAEGPRLCGPFAVFLFPQKKYCMPFAKKANATQYLKKSISNLLLLYLTTRTLYIPSISLSSSNALADAALSRSIRV